MPLLVNGWISFCIRIWYTMFTFYHIVVTRKCCRKKMMIGSNFFGTFLLLIRESVSWHAVSMNDWEYEMDLKQAVDESATLMRTTFMAVNSFRYYTFNDNFFQVHSPFLAQVNLYWLLQIHHYIPLIQAILIKLPILFLFVERS